LAGDHLHRTGGQPFVERLFWPKLHPSHHLQHRFIAQVAGELGIHRDLDGATAITQIQKDQAAMVAAPVHPAAELNGLIDGITTQIAASVTAHRGRGKESASFPWQQPRPGPLRPPIERPLHHKRRLGLAANLHLQFGAELGRLGWHAGQGDGFAKRR